MSWGFEIGRVYNRRTNIHARFGGQQQGGIITPARYSLVIIITGEQGLEHGYADRHRPDGVFEYFGEGQRGDMQLTNGNKAIADHSKDGESLLLFHKTREGLRFEGEMVCESYHMSALPTEKEMTGMRSFLNCEPSKLLRKLLNPRWVRQERTFKNCWKKLLRRGTSRPVPQPQDLARFMSEAAT
jgi:hypothetical protein